LSITVIIVSFFIKVSFGTKIHILNQFSFPLLFDHILT
jgi:hypothetical protein